MERDTRYTMHVHTAGYGEGYTMHVHTASYGEGYTLHVHTAGYGERYKLYSTMLVVEMDTPSTSTPDV
jgi:hypothetical protein